MVILWIIALAIMIFFGWMGYMIAKKFDIHGVVGTIIGVIILILLVVLIPFLRGLTYFLLTGCCQ